LWRPSYCLYQQLCALHRLDRHSYWNRIHRFRQSLSPSDSGTGAAPGGNRVSATPLITAPWSSYQPLPSTIDYNYNGNGTSPGGGTSALGPNRGATIGTAAAGVVTPIFILVLLWTIFVREKRATKVEETSTYHITAVSHKNTGEGQNIQPNGGLVQQHRYHDTTPSV